MMSHICRRLAEVFTIINKRYKGGSNKLSLGIEWKTSFIPTEKNSFTYNFLNTPVEACETVLCKKVGYWCNLI